VFQMIDVVWTSCGASYKRESEIDAQGRSRMARRPPPEAARSGLVCQAVRAMNTLGKGLDP